DLLGRHGDDAPQGRHVRGGVAALKSTAAHAAAEPAADAHALESWFEDTMDRLSGIYKRRLQTITVVVAAVVTLAVNADTVRMIGALSRAPAAGASVAPRTERAQASRPIVASYPDVNRPISAGTDETSAEDQDANAAPRDEDAHAGALIGWSADFRRLN